MPAALAGPKCRQSAARCRPKNCAVPTCRNWCLACQILLTYLPRSVRWNGVHSFGLQIALQALPVKTTLLVQGRRASLAAPVAEQGVAVLGADEGERCRCCAAEGQTPECVGRGASSQSSVAMRMRALGRLHC